jgi:hypothetical protein
MSRDFLSPTLIRPFTVVKRKLDYLGGKIYSFQRVRTVKEVIW